MPPAWHRACAIFAARCVPEHGQQAIPASIRLLAMPVRIVFLVRSAPGRKYNARLRRLEQRRRRCQRSVRGSPGTPRSVIESGASACP